ncbi:unnamed protein product [Ascophyllum nodosum]
MLPPRKGRRQLELARLSGPLASSAPTAAPTAAAAIPVAAAMPAPVPVSAAAPARRAVRARRRRMVPLSVMMMTLATLVGRMEAFVIPGTRTTGVGVGSPVSIAPAWGVTGRRQVYALGRRERGVSRDKMARQGMSTPRSMSMSMPMAAVIGRGASAAAAAVGQHAYPNNVKAAALAVYSLAISVQPSILILASKAVLKLVAACAVGYVASRKGILDQTAITSLSKLIFFVFQPCLLFVNVASTLGTPGQKLSKLLIVPVFAVLMILVGSVVGRGMERVLSLKPGSPESRELRMCTSFANSGPLPLLFVDSIFGSHPDTTIVTSAVAYISFYLLGWSPMFWTAGYTMVAGKPQPSSPMSAADAEHFRRLTPLRKAVVTCQRIKASPSFKRIVSPPVMGCVAGMVVGLLPWGKTLLLGKSAPLSPVFDAIKRLGSAYLPAAILVLAGSIAPPGSKPAAAAAAATTAATEGTSGSSAAFAKRVVAIMASRFLVMPFVAAGLLMSGARMKLIPYDKVLWFVLLMQGCMPSAQNSVVILQMEKKPERAASMAKTLTAVYLLSAVPMAVLLSGILQFVQI